MFLVEKVAILGAGLLGGSLAKALKARNLAKTVSVWSRSQSTRAKCAKLANVFDQVCEAPEAAVANADIVVICTPTSTIPALARQVLPALKSGAVLTDVGSVKGAICRECSAFFEGKSAYFVGSHPMAGSEKIGVDYADAGLFEGRPCFVAGAAGAPQAALVAEMWAAAGMKVYQVSPAEHDAIVARISHLPHLIAGTLCAVSADYPSDLRPYAGPGFRDTTRVASGSPDIWDSIIFDNQAEILAALKGFSKSLGELIYQIETGDRPAVARRLRAAKEFRDGLR